MREFAEAIILSWGKLVGLAICAIVVGGVEFAIASDVTVDQRNVHCVADRVEASGTTPRIALRCGSSSRQFYTMDAGHVVERAMAGRPIRFDCRTYRFTDQVDHCK